MDLDEITAMYRVRKTVFQMLKDRGYIISERKLAQTKQEFADFYASGPRDKLNTLVTKRKAGDELTDDGGENKMFVFFHDQEKLNEAAVKQIAHTMLTNRVFNSMVIVKGTTQVGRKVRKDF
jgi:DNA-directed RNA polymerase I, II, and III subunit RPABC1